jgi:hypothetical protein
MCLLALTIATTGCARDQHESSKNQEVDVAWKGAVMYSDSSVKFWIHDYSQCRAVTQERNERVRITAKCKRSSHDPGSGSTPLSAELSDPLGDRELIDGADGSKALVCRPPLVSIDIGEHKCKRLESTAY